MSIAAIDTFGAPTMAAPITVSDLSTLSGYYDADSSQNSLSQISNNFTPSQVDTTNNIITITTLPLPDITYQNFVGMTRVYFDTNGTLPAPLKQGVPYFAENTGSGLALYPVATNADYSKYPGGVKGDTVWNAQLATQNSGRIVLTGQGSGTHRIYTEKVLTNFKDLTGNGFDFQNSTTTDYQQLYELIDEGNFKYLQDYGPESQKWNILNVHASYGKTLSLLSTMRDTFRQRYSAKNRIYQVAGIKVRRYKNEMITKLFLFGNSNINISTGVITSPDGYHGFATGNLVNFLVPSGATAPTPTTGAITDDYYVRVITTTSPVTVSLHPTATDASNNTNKILFSNAGSGTFTLAAVKRMWPITDNLYTIDFNDPAVVNHHLGNIGFFNYIGTSSANKKAAFQSGLNGRITYASSGAGQSVLEATPLVLMYPGRAVMPITSDRSVSLGFAPYISGITNGTTTTLTVGSGHGVQAGDTAYIEGVAGMTNLNGNTYAVASVTTTTVTISVDSTYFPAWTSGGRCHPVLFATRSVSSGRQDTDLMLHRTKSEAQAQSGVADTSRTRIQFTNYSTFSEMDAQDEWRMFYVDGCTGIYVGANQQIPGIRVPFETLCVLAATVDFQPSIATYGYSRQTGAVTPSGINAATGVITKSNHLFVAGQTAVGVVSGSNALPTNTPTGLEATPKVGWVRVIDTSNFSLHPGKNDAALTAFTVSGATNASPIVVTANGHGLTTGQPVVIAGVLGNTAANGTYVITVVDANTFSLNGSTGNGAYTSGGSGGRVITYADTGSGTWTYGNVCALNSISINGGTPYVFLDSNEPWAPMSAWASATQSPFIIGNAGEPHVPGPFKMNALLHGTSNTLATLNSEVASIVSRLKTKYGLP